MKPGRTMAVGTRLLFGGAGLMLVGVGLWRFHHATSLLAALLGAWLAVIGARMRAHARKALQGEQGGG